MGCAMRFSNTQMRRNVVAKVRAAAGVGMAPAAVAPAAQASGGATMATRTAAVPAAVGQPVVTQPKRKALIYSSRSSGLGMAGY